MIIFDQNKSIKLLWHELFFLFSQYFSFCLSFGFSFYIYILLVPSSIPFAPLYLSLLFFDSFILDFS
ncbi:hypothetical protein CJP74_01785 [Psittacicella melopsittaci]|uniref:Uncharacterized protein n=1 Tax=Psittacicella melopsittaci TaxID=2028576 RepID=A0A3A1Y7I8_9GAMM|nr:hypothetical protein CJP74_01785 [Psittacicella melopsittaci]